MPPRPHITILPFKVGFCPPPPSPPPPSSCYFHPPPSARNTLFQLHFCQKLGCPARKQPFGLPLDLYPLGCTALPDFCTFPFLAGLWLPLPASQFPGNRASPQIPEPEEEGGTTGTRCGTTAALSLQHPHQIRMGPARRVGAVLPLPFSVFLMASWREAGWHLHPLKQPHENFSPHYLAWRCSRVWGGDSTEAEMLAKIFRFSSLQIGFL